MKEQTQYFGTKEVLGIPMNRLDYNNLRGWNLPSDENGSDEGYLVEYVDGGQANHLDYDGYISWSPKNVFQKAYKPNGSLSFGDAILAMKSGARVARRGWNGKDMYAVLMNGYPSGVPANKETALKHGIKEGELIKVRPYLALWTAQKDLATWTPSGSDCLAEDWEIANS